MSHIYKYEDFYATCDHLPGPDTSEARIRVGGTVVFRGGGYAAKLSAAEPNGAPPFNPLTLHLDLTITAPTSGGTSEIKPVELAEFVESPPAFEYTQVHFRLAGAPDDTAPPIVEVGHPVEADPPV